MHTCSYLVDIMCVIENNSADAFVTTAEYIFGAVIHKFKILCIWSKTI
jgi:hypothetical protein